MRDLAGGMDAGIGAPGGGDAGRGRIERAQGGLDRLLHRRLPRLALPAGEAAAMVFDLQRISRHAFP